MKLFITLILLNVWFLTYTQVDSLTVLSQNVQAVHIDRDFDLKYQQKLWQLKRAYPLALEAKSIIDTYEEELATIEKKRKKAQKEKR